MEEEFLGCGLLSHWDGDDVEVNLDTVSLEISTCVRKGLTGVVWWMVARW